MTPVITEVSPRPLVLVTNDDGIASPGLHALAREIERRGMDAVVAAPAANMSGASAAIGPVDPTVPTHRHVIDGFRGEAFAVHSPPAMIVIAALNGAFGAIPTAVASGVNDGVNLGRAILHSGTVGAALTGQNLGLPSLAVSVEPGADWALAASFGVDALEELLARSDPAVANVNVPAGVTSSTDRIETDLAKFGAATAAIIGEALDFKLTIEAGAMNEPGTDAAALAGGKVSVTWLSGFAGSVDTVREISLRAVRTDVDPPR